MSQAQTIQEINERRAKIAEATGADPQAVRLDIAKMLELGLLVDIDLHGFSMLKAKVSWEELGVRPQDARRKRIRRGQKYLAPSTYVKALNSMESRFRQSLDKHSHDLDAFRPWRWVPYTAYDAWQEEWGALTQELEALKDEILDNYDAIVEENRTYFEGVAEKAWRAYQAGRDPTDEAVVITEDKDGNVQNVFTSFDDFRDNIVKGALAQMPSRDAVKHGIFGDYKTGYLVAPPELAVLNAQQDAEAWQAEQERAKAERAFQQKRHEREMQRLEERQARKRLAAMHEAELERAREQLKHVTSPFQEAIDKFRARIYDDVLSIAESLKKNGTLVGRVATKAKGLSELYRVMGAATSDAELEAALAHLDAALEKPGADSKYSATAIEDALEEIVDVTAQAAAEVEQRANAHTRARALEF